MVIIEPEKPSGHIIVSYGRKHHKSWTIKKDLNALGIDTKGYLWRNWALDTLITNPYKVPTLKKLTGRDEAVQQYLLRCKATTTWVNTFSSYVSIMYGPTIFCLNCIGGQHRSVAMAELIVKKFKEAGITTLPKIIHMDLKGEEETNGTVVCGKEA